MRCSVLLPVLLFAASTGLADPLITSVTPNEGPTKGGTAVVITGTGFSNACPVCLPPFYTPNVYFGVNAATSVHYVDSTTIEAVTPPHLPGRVSVTVVEFDTSASVSDAFLFTGEIEDTFDRILFPIFMPPVQGAFGSEFHTNALVWNQSSTVLPLFGFDTNCSLADPPILPDRPLPLGVDGTELHLFPDCSTSTGRVFYVPKGRGSSLAANLRVSDVTRQAASHGVEIPVVREQDFREGRISLLNVPIDPKFRNTLRIYALKPGSGFVNVTIGNEQHAIALTAGADVFEPWFGSFSEFPAASELPGNPSTVRVVIDTPEGPGMPIWGFISVTNNVTQEITLVTPN